MWVGLMGSALAQDTLLVPATQLEETYSERGWFVAMQAGVVKGELDAVNEQLARNLYGPLSEGILAMGLSFDRYQGRFVYGGQLYNFMTTQSRLNGQTALMQYHYGIIHAGHRLWRKGDKQQVYLTGGMGYGGAFMRIRLALAQQSERFDAGGPLVDLAIHAHHQFILQGREANIARVSLSLGYLHGFDNAWIMRGFDPDGLGLPVSPQGPYLRISLGMGTWSGFERKQVIRD